MELLALIASLLPQVLRFSAVNVENADVTLFKLSDNTVNLGCINTDTVSVQIYIDNAGAPDTTDQALEGDPDRTICVEADGVSAQAQVLDVPLFKVDRTFEFNTALKTAQQNTRLNGVPIHLARADTSLSVKLKNLSSAIDLGWRDGELDFVERILRHKPCPDDISVTDPSARLRRLLNQAGPPKLASGGADDFALFQLKPGRGLPIGGDTVKFSKGIYRDVFALCRLDPRPEGEFAVKSYHLVAIQKEPKP